MQSEYVIVSLPVSPGSAEFIISLQSESIIS